QRLEIVEDVDAASEGADDEIVAALLDLQIADGDRRQSAFDLDPVAAAVLADEESELRAGVEQVLVERVFDDDVRAAALRQVAGDRLPRRAAVGALVDVRLE